METKYGQHFSVLKDETIKALAIKPDGIYVDCTLGLAGHSKEILSLLTTGKLYCFDQDIEAIKQAQQVLKPISDKYEIIKANFKDLEMQLAIRDVTKINGIIYDLGVSSPQLDNMHRGFSYRYDSKLDMRMDLSKDLSAYHVVNQYDQNALSKIFWLYGEEKFADRIAIAIVKARQVQPIITTGQLVDVIKTALPQKILKKSKHPAKKIFQAIRIEVNDELNVLEKSLHQALSLLATNGRLVVISFHSLEDRIVKTIFKKYTTCENERFLQKIPLNITSNIEYRLVNKRAISASEEEIRVNKRSHSAKMRIIEYVG